MYELCRVRLFSVGPPGARYADLTLDFRDVGTFVRKSVQEALFGAEQAPTVRRPSPATVLFLENGGGKSVLMKLIFSVVLPGRRQVVGTTSTRVLEKFVRGTDVAHVLLEWQHTESGARVITGKVSEWRNHTVSTDPNKLIDAWYSFRPTANFTLETVPVTDEGRLVTLSGFKDRFAEADRVEPELQGVWRSGHRDWTDHLSALGLDPELFRYQRDMNAGEGEAADAFTFKTDDAFVDFLLRAVTDEEKPAGLAEVIEGYSDKLASRGALVVERDFVAGALAHLEPLRQLHNAAVEARDRVDAASSSAHRFHAAVSMRCEQERLRREAAQAHVEETASQERQYDREVSRLGAVLLEIQRLVAEMRLNQAKEKQEKIKNRRSEATLRLQAWRSCGTVLDARAATAEATALRNLLAEQEEYARPALDARDAAARQLARGLLVAAKTADAAAAAANNAVTELRESENEETEKAGALRTDAARLTERAESLDQQVRDVMTAVQDHVRAGMLADGADVGDEAAIAAAVAHEAEQAIGRAFDEQDQLATAVDSWNAELTRANNAVESARQDAELATETARTVADLAKRLSGEPRLAALLGADAIELDTDIPEMLQQLGAATDAATTEMTEIHLIDNSDTRVLNALGDGGLLPPSDDVDATVEQLTAVGITAWPGWRYLSQMGPDRQKHILECHPDLVGGVVINDPDKLDDARDVLTRARLLPRSLVAVGTTAAMNAEAQPPQGVGFLVPPNPALYDEAQAEIERTAIATRHQHNRERLAALEEQKAKDTELVRRLREFQATYPPGRRQEIEAAEITTRSAYAAATATASTRKAEYEQARQAHDQHRASLPELHKIVSTMKERARTLEDLATRVGHVQRWTTEAHTLRRQSEDHESRATEADDRARSLRSESEAKLGEAGDHRRTAFGHREEFARVPGAGSVSETDLPPTDPLDSLRQRFQAAEEAYRKAEVDADLRSDLATAEKRESDTRDKVEVLDQRIRELITELIASPDGGDAASRAAATHRAGDEVEALTAEWSVITEQVGSLRTAFEQFTEQDRSLEPYGRPTDIAHGHELIELVHGDLATARTAHEQSKDAVTQAESEHDAAKVAVGGFAAVLELLEDAAPDRSPDESLELAYEGSVEEAKWERFDIRQALTAARSGHEQAEAQVRRAADNLAQYAGDARFEGMTSPVRRQITAIKRDDLPLYATEWHTSLQPRLRNLTADLEQIDQHRRLIINLLAGLVEHALADLRTAQRLSRLPDTLGDWSGQEFLRFKFDGPAENSLYDRIAEVVDTLGGTGPAAKRDGISLVLRGVHAAVPKGFRVDMLKPDAVLRTERVRVAEIHDVFSGGQQLTAAIILYCTLAALRANDRGRARQRHSGVLFLDNPIGRASAGYLLELQFAVAEALGVQLVYTTGLFDSGALSVFPLIIRLRNDADLRAGLKYLSVDSTVRRELEALGEPDGTGHVSATRLFHRPTDSVPAS